MKVRLRWEKVSVGDYGKDWAIFKALVGPLGTDPWTLRRWERWLEGKDPMPEVFVADIRLDGDK